MTENLPAVPLPDEVADVVDGVVVSAPEPPAVRPVYVLQVITVVVRHPVPRAAVRHAGYVPAGVVVAFRRWRARRSLPHDIAHRSHLAGDNPMALEMLKQAELERKGRADRRKQHVEMFRDLVHVSPYVIALWAFLMLMTGICLAWARHNPADLLWPWRTLAAVVSGAVTAAEVLVWVLAFGIPLALLARLWWLGAHGGDLAPGWAVAARQDEEERGLVVTADTIVVALQNLPVPAMAKAFKDGWVPSFTLQPVRDGRGYESEFSLPLGVTAEMIADRRPVLARNMHREEIETWPSASKPGYARLWVADPGAVSKAAPEYPLLHEGQADVFRGVPGGVLARGDGAEIPVVAANGVLGGLMGQGKSNAGRVIILGCATDPLCGIDVWVFANNGDFDAYEPRLARYEKGLDDDVIAASVDRLHEAYRDVGDRENMLADLGAKKLTRQIAEQYPQLRPHVSLFSECHELFGHPEYGELAGELAVKIVKRQRKTGRVCWFDTQSSRKAAIPGALVELVSVNCCFAVKSWRSNDGFLGDGSFSAGIRATELRPGRDRGTSLATGISDAQFELLKWYFIEVDDDTGYDAARPVIERCMQTVAPGTPVGNAAPVIVVRDLLDDLAMVIDGPWRVSVNELPHRLKRLDATWPEYRKLTGAQLRKRLTELGVRTTNTDNKPELDPSELHRALGERERMSELP